MVFVIDHSISIHFCTRHMAPPGQNVSKIIIIAEVTKCLCCCDRPPYFSDRMQYRGVDSATAVNDVRAAVFAVGLGGLCSKTVLLCYDAIPYALVSYSAPTDFVYARIMLIPRLYTVRMCVGESMKCLSHGNPLMPACVECRSGDQQLCN